MHFWLHCVTSRDIVNQALHTCKYEICGFCQFCQNLCQSKLCKVQPAGFMLSHVRSLYYGEMVEYGRVLEI